MAGCDHLAIMATHKGAGQGAGQAPRRRTRREIDLAAQRDATITRLGNHLAAARRRRRRTQQQLADRVGISRATLSRMELGRGHGAPIGTWLALAAELGLTPRFELQRDWREDPVDAGHLAVQELLLRLARVTGHDRRFELRTRSSDPSRSIDVNWRSDRARRLIVIEAWNTIGDIGAGVRSFQRKLADAEELATILGDGQPYEVRGVWVVRATRRNRDLVARYPEVFRAAFPGSSAAWTAALTTGTPPPDRPGLVWCDVRATRVFAWRYSTTRSGGSSSPGG
jgi:transcriptional regulator with XRE-family HTH domain